MKSMLIGNIPFYFDMQRKPHNPEGIPDAYSFYVCEDDNGVIVQRRSAETEEWLKRAYSFGSNISGLMDAGGIGNDYAQDFKKFILKNQDVRGKRVLDIGCGTGYLLKLLHDCGAVVEGVEPGEYGRIGREKYHLNIRHGFFDYRDYKDKFDIIIFYGVLEHIGDYDAFLSDVRNLLHVDGKIFIGVPDCEGYMQRGDASVFVSVHWNYFTEPALKRVLHSHGMACAMEKAGYGGAIYACCSPSNTVQEATKESYSRFDFDVFSHKVEQGREKVRKLFDDYAGVSIGVYCPGRIINYYENAVKTSNGNIRFFDDDNRFHGLYYPSIPIPMENYDDLQKTPVDIMLIASTTFGDVLKQKCLDAGVRECVLLKELLDENSDNI